MATPEEMELAAPDAENDLTQLTDALDSDQMVGVTALANWWAKWVGKVGHKRLGRILLQYKEG